MALEITIWEPGKPWRNAVMVPLFVLLSPAILLAFGVVALISLVRGHKKPAGGSDDS